MATKIDNMSKKKLNSKGGVPKDTVSEKQVIKKEPSNDSLTNNLSIDDIFRFMELYFDRYGVLYGHLYNSFNKFLEEDIVQYLTSGDHTFFEKMTKDKIIKYMFQYDKISVKPPTLDNDVEPMFPSDARNKNMTYFGKLLATVTQIQEITDIATNEVKRIVIGSPEENIPIANMPIMMRSKYCSLSIYPKYDKRECEYDPGGYFIVGGSEKVILSQDRMAENKPMVFLKKESGLEYYTVQITSKSYRPHGLVQIINIRVKKDNIISIRVPILNEVNVFAVFRALGIESDKDIIRYVVGDDNDFDMIELMKNSLDKCINDREEKIQTKEDAEDYLIGKIRLLKKYTETDKDIKNKQKKLHLQDLLKNSFFPHIESPDPKIKAFYLGYMVNKLLKTIIGRTKTDDRDSYLNKRIDLPGDLLMELFKQFYRKMLNDCNKFFKKRNSSDEEPLNIIGQIKPNIIEQGIRASLSTGAWPRRKGVAQVLQRLTYLQSLAFLRRVDAPGGDASSSKLTSPRHLHPSSASLLCCVTGDSEILLGDNMTVEQIKNMKDGDNIVSVYKDSLKEVPSRIKNYFTRNTDKVLLQIKTISGRTLKCTKDHPLLIRRNGSNIMVNAGDLKVNDQVIVRHTQKYLPLVDKTNHVLKSENVSDFYKQDLINLGMIDKQISQEKLEITARLLGANITDGHLGSRKEDTQYESSFFVGEINDAYNIVDDIMKLGFGTASIERRISTHTNKKNGIQTIHKTWGVIKNGAFAYYLALMGGIIGKKTQCIKELPEWITKGSDRIKREFLSGFQGGDGCKIVMQHNESTFKLALGPTYQTSSKELEKDSNSFMRNISQLFKHFDISSKVVTQECDEEGKVKVGIYIDNTYENLGKYVDMIGYRYCDEKQRKSAPVVEYIKYKTNFSNTKQEKYDTIEKLYKEGKKPAQIQSITNIEPSVIKRIIENINKDHKPKPREFENNFMKYDAFIKQYYIENLNLAVPIQEITEIPTESVYDFETTLDSHTLIVNGFVTSNCVQTPEHAKVGLTKHLSLVASITIMKNTQLQLIKSYFQSKNKLVDIRDVPSDKFKEYTKVFLNGEPLGLTKEPIKLCTELRKNKLTGTFDPTMSVVHNIHEREIRVYCESGRMYRPIMRVTNNQVNLTKEIINSTSTNKSDKSTKITSWAEFMNKNNEVIEYIDMEEQPFLMIAENINKVEHHRKLMTDSIKKVNTVKDNNVTNRYDDMLYVKYTHCEFHPSFLLGEIATNIPFCNHNQGPRNIFQYSQGLFFKPV
jgi:DNA-directed RNA polymerase beta subunit